MSTLTEARQSVTRAVAEVRSLGVKVAHVIGHAPDSGRYIYSLRLPDRYNAAVIGRCVSLVPTGEVYVPRFSDGHHVIVSVPSAFDWSITDKAARRNNLREQAERAASLLELIAARIADHDRIDRDVIVAALTEDELPIRADEARDRIITRDDGSVLVRLFGTETQRQALDLLRPIVRAAGLIAEPVGDDEVIVRIPS